MSNDDNAWRHPKTEENAKRVLESIKKYPGGASSEVIAEDSGLSRSVVMNALCLLKVRKKIVASGTGRGRNVTYRAVRIGRKKLDVMEEISRLQALVDSLNADAKNAAFRYENAEKEKERLQAEINELQKKLFIEVTRVDNIQLELEQVKKQRDFILHEHSGGVSFPVYCSACKHKGNLMEVEPCKDCGAGSKFEWKVFEDG